MQRALLGLLLGLTVGCGPSGREPATGSTPGSEPTPGGEDGLPPSPPPPPYSDPAPPAGADRPPARPEKTMARSLDQLWTEPGLATLKAATRVETFRVDPGYGLGTNKTQIGGYGISSTGKEQGKEFASKLSAILLKPETYFFEKAKRCMFQPGVAYRLWKDQDAVEVVVCFSCDEIEVFVKDGAGKITHYSGEDFDNARAGMVALARQAFPNDKEVQSLPVARE